MTRRSLGGVLHSRGTPPKLRCVISGRVLRRVGVQDPVERQCLLQVPVRVSVIEIAYQCRSEHETTV